MNKEILKRYFEGKASQWEKKQVEKYFEGNDDNAFKEYIEQEDKLIPDVNIEESFKNNFYNDMLKKIEMNEKPKKLRAFSLSPYLKIAASLLLLSGITVALYTLKKHNDSIVAQPEYVNISNTENKVKITTLMDGTKIWLTPGSTLTYDSKHFGDTTRDINILGEAYFDVAHNAAKSFKVHVGQLTTTVLGTAFNVEAYQNEDNVRVMLVRGHVRVSFGHNTKDLLPGHMLEYERNNNSMSIKKIEIADKQEEFTSGKLVFERVALKDVISRLQKVFVITINTESPDILTNKWVSGSYYRDYRDETLQDILFMHGLKLKKKGDKAYVITY